jgi:hypothetical protein
MNNKRIPHLLIAFFLAAMTVAACGPVSTPTTAPAMPTAVPATVTEPPPTVMPTSTPVPPTPTAPLTETSPAATDKPVGIYRAKLPVNSSLGISAGYYRLTLQEDGSYTIGWAPSQKQEGLVGVHGTYNVDGDQIVFTDVEGPAICTAEEGASGTYQWSLSNQGLTLTPMNDTCEVRLYVLSTKPLPRD